MRSDIPAIAFPKNTKAGSAVVLLKLDNELVVDLYWEES